ncbi:MAG: FRG domain-containing protein [Treponema sp.]|nr:FRG domain-containing protein [Treponema sp.]
MAKLSALERKGIGEVNGRVQTRPVMIESRGSAKDKRLCPIWRGITCLADFFALLKEVHDEKEKQNTQNDNWSGTQFFYRGQNKVDFMFTPSMIRAKGDLEREHLVFREFHRRFFMQLDECKTAMEEETFLQHFGAGSRILDLMENPLVALWAGCYGEKDENKDKYGEVSIWCVDNNTDKLKSYDSSTVSVLANIAKMESTFLLGKLEQEYLKENPTALTDYIFIKDVLRRSVVVRPKPNNIRIYNQQGSFAVVNLTRLIEKEDNGRSFYSKFGVSLEKFSDYILNAEVINKGRSFEYTHPNVSSLRKNYHTLRGADFSELTSWDLQFEKIVPEESDFIDSYGLYEYLYNSAKNRDQIAPVYAIIPPECKSDILKELKYMNITKAFIYPEMQNIAAELKNEYCKKEK